MADLTHLRDFLYLDTEKAASIFSQLYGGLIQETREESEQGRDRRRALALKLGVANAELGNTLTDRNSVIESRVLHHALLLEIEDGLFDLGTAVDLNAEFVDQPPATAEEVRSALGDETAYVRVEGWAALEDYDRISTTAEEFPALVDFINRSALSGVEGSDEYKQLVEQLEEAKVEARTLPDKQARNRRLREVGLQEKQLEQTLQGAVEIIEPLEPWFIEGLQRWLRVFLPGRITLRIYPFEGVPSFQVFGNLKRDSFVDADLGNLLFAYGARPNVQLTLLGLITSLPSRSGAVFDPLQEFADAEEIPGEPEDDADESAPAAAEQSDPAAFEKAFRTMFEAMEGMEAFGRFSRYPNVTVYPIAVYRRVPIPTESGD